MKHKTAKGLLFGRRTARHHQTKAVRPGRVHHVAHVVNDEIYWQAVNYLADNDLAQSADLPTAANSSQAYEIINDLKRWGWVDYNESWTISDAGAKAVAIQRKKKSS